MENHNPPSGTIGIRRLKYNIRVQTDDFKRVIVLSGHYGSGKTNIALQLAFDLKKLYDRVVIADIDIVNPYFRTKDSESELEAAGIKLISSEFAGSNVDLPALPQAVNAVTDDKTLRAVIDVGGDDRGATALGRWSEKLVTGGDCEMLMVVNMYRPLTGSAAEAVEIVREIERAGRLPFTGIVNNSNLGAATTAADVLASLEYAGEIARVSGLPIRMTAVKRELFTELSGRIENLLPLDIRYKGSYE